MTPDPIGDAVAWVSDAKLLAYPTETVWGLGADAGSDEALESLREWKGRDEETPVSILVSRADALGDLGIEVTESARRLVDAFWPGPLTLVLPSRKRFAAGVARADGAVGVRCSSHPLCASIAKRLQAKGVGPLTATSLNRHGAPPARTAAEARAACGAGDARLRMLAVEGAEAGGDAASTVVDATGKTVRVLRWGAVGEDDLKPVLREIELQ